jgi:hypothetical protein
LYFYRLACKRERESKIQILEITPILIINYPIPKYYFGWTSKNMEKVPETNTEKNEIQKLEWGADFGYMTWYSGRVKADELNKSLPEGEKKWRLPTADELQAEFKKTGSTPAGFQVEAYWSNDQATDKGYNGAYFVNMYNGQKEDGFEGEVYGRVRLVRD